MRKELTATWSLLLLLSMCAYGSGAREINENQLVNGNVLRLPSMDAKQENDDANPSSSSSSHMHGGHSIPPEKARLYFTMAEMKVGNKIPIFWPDTGPSIYPPTFPREIAESIPFSSKQLDQILDYFSLSKDSPQAKDIAQSLAHCEAEPDPEEILSCPRSDESMRDFVGKILGLEHSQFLVLETKHLTDSKTKDQNYTVHQVLELDPDNKVACHPLPYPYPVSYCHTEAGTLASRVALEGENGDRVEAIVTCHLDLKLRGSQACHLLYSHNLIWVPRTHASESEMSFSTKGKDVHHDDQPRIHRERIHANPLSHKNSKNMLYFTLTDLKVGNKMTVSLPKRDPSTYPHLLPREIAESLPFSSKQFDQMLEFFSLSKDSPQAKDIEITLNHCEAEPITGETKFCPRSVESMLDFVRDVLGVGPHFRALETKHLTASKTKHQNYTIHEVLEEIRVPKMVACHLLPYPHAMFYCHRQADTITFRVALEGENGDRIEAVVSCHLDTSEWDPRHVAFEILGKKPGSSEACHFFHATNLMWVPRKHA